MSATVDPAPGPARRGFLKGLLTAGLGALAAVIPPSLGLAVFVHPWRRGARTGAGGFVKVTTLSAVPPDGVPRRFMVVADRRNVWSTTPAVPVGAIYLRRTDETRLQAFNVICPHAGCLVDYAPARRGFFCPCHNSAFELDGRVAEARSPSPRGLDALAVEVRNGAEVWVKFQNYRPGFRDQIPV